MVVHQFVGSALFAAGTLHHHFNQQGSASSPKHSATIGKPRWWSSAHSPATGGDEPASPASPPTLSVCLVVGMTACRLLKQLCRSQHSTRIFKDIYVESDTSLSKSVSWKLVWPALCLMQACLPPTTTTTTTSLLPNVLLLSVQQRCATVLTADYRRSWLKRGHCTYLSVFSRALHQENKKAMLARAI